MQNAQYFIFLGNFAMKFQFAVQDEVQNYDWYKAKYTLHAIAVYYKSNDGFLNHFNSFLMTMSTVCTLYIKSMSILVIK